MKKLSIGLVGIALLGGQAAAEPRITYVGHGRYVCSGSAKECEPVYRRNEGLELQQRQLQELERQREELQRQTETMREERRQRDYKHD